MISAGDTVDNLALYETFGVGNSGGMRRSVENSCLVIIADWTMSAVKNRWEGDTLHYTGQGKGNQKIEKQNQTLANSGTSGERLFLFEVKKQGEYTVLRRSAAGGRAVPGEPKGRRRSRANRVDVPPQAEATIGVRPADAQTHPGVRACAGKVVRESRSAHGSSREADRQQERNRLTNSGGKWGFLTEETELSSIPRLMTSASRPSSKTIGRSDEFVRIREAAITAFDMPDPPASLTEQTGIADVDELRAAMDQRKPKKHRFDDFK